MLGPKNCLVYQRFRWNENRRILRAQKFCQGFFWGVLASCSKGRDEPHLPTSANLKTPPSYITVGLWWNCSNDTRCHWWRWGSKTPVVDKSNVFGKLPKLFGTLSVVSISAANRSNGLGMKACHSLTHSLTHSHGPPWWVTQKVDLRGMNHFLP